MAFLRSICGHRTTNLVYSRGSTAVRYEITSTSSSPSLSIQNNLRYSSSSSSGQVNDQTNRQLNCHEKQQEHPKGFLAQQKQTPLELFNSNQKRILHSDAAKSRSDTFATATVNPNTRTSSKTVVYDDDSRKPGREPLDTSFNDSYAAFKSKTTWELTRAYLVYFLCSSEKLVENNLKLMKWTHKLLGTKLFTLLMKATFYGHFVAGEDEIKIVPTLERLRSFGVKPILDYSVEEDLSQEEAEKREVASSVSSAAGQPESESLPQYHVDKSFADRRYKVSSARTYFYLNEATCERNMDIFIKCLEAVSGATFGTGFTAIKLTALGRPQLLLQLSEVIMRTRNYMEDLVGGHGNVLTHHKTIKDLEKYYTSLGDNKDVKDFLKNVTSDKEGLDSIL